MTTKTYTELLDSVSIKITPNEAAVLASLAKAFVAEHKSDMNANQVENWVALIDKLNPQIDCGLHADA